MTKGNKRLAHESQKGYRKRLNRENQLIKGYLRGRRIWSYAEPYERRLHGEIGRKLINQ